MSKGCRIFPKEDQLERTNSALKRSFINHLHYTLAKDETAATQRDFYLALAYTVRDHLMDRWIQAQRTFAEKDPKRVYYLSLEFLIGRSLGNNLQCLDMMESIRTMLKDLGLDLDALRESEWDAGLGNGGLGRLAACYLDSLATLGVPSVGYGLRYEYGIFYQRIRDGYQVETPDSWLRYGNPWEVARSQYLYPVRFYGRVHEYMNEEGQLKHDWVDCEEVMAMAYDTPVPGYQNNCVNTMRLWSAKSSRDFNLEYFNHGNYIQAVEEKNISENISRVLYPNDNIEEGKTLRLKQEYFLVSATLQDIIRRFKTTNDSFDTFPDKAAVQMNDTHPALAVAELMRLLMDEEGISWDHAWTITRNSLAYTNHTVLPEALEKWPLEMLSKLLPRHVQIIFEINERFLKDASPKLKGDEAKVRNVSIIEEGDTKHIRMANLAIVGSHAVNGVSALHTEILKDHLFADFYKIYPERFQNKTNGVTPRRFLAKCNEGLAKLITDHIGSQWIYKLEELEKLVPLAKDKKFQKAWREVRRHNKERFAKVIEAEHKMPVNLDSMFDAQIKRIHEYKRQLLCVFHAIWMYNEIKDNPTKAVVPRTILIGGKAAPGYHLAKLIIKFINSVADVINNDKDIGDKLKLHFMSNYRVSLAEKMIPASDLSEQISLAGLEASGTGNMKFALNGALTVGTLDGANVEIREHVGKDNIFIFGMKTDEVMQTRKEGYNPYDYYNNDPCLKRIIDMIRDGYFGKEPPDLFKPIIDSLLDNGDYFMHLKDFRSYIECQQGISKAFLDQDRWTEMSILNVAGMGYFSSDRAVKEYADQIWGAKPIESLLPPERRS